MVFCCWHLKKTKAIRFQFAIFLVIDIYCFFDLLLFWWLWYMVGIFLMICSSVCNFSKIVFMLFYTSHLTRKFRDKTHTHTHTPHCFSLKNHGQNFFLNHLFLQFNSKINHGFYFCELSLSEEIRGILFCKNEFCKNICLPKYMFRKNLFF